MKGRERHGGGAKPIAKDIVQQIIRINDPKTLVEEADRFGKELAKNRLTKAQIRNIFGTVRQIEASWQTAKDSEISLRRLLLLQPKLAYQAARSTPVKPLQKVLTDAIQTVAEVDAPEEQLKRFGRFVDLFESILAYHTEAGGK
jgi:CRISPR-associated protein Csm2